MWNLLKSLNHFNATGEVIACDESLADHDKRFHPDGFRDGDTCKFRENLAKGDSTDSSMSSQAENSPQTSTVYTLTDSDRAALNNLHRALIEDDGAKKLAKRAYNLMSGKTWSGIENGQVAQSLPDDLIRWCEDTFVKAVANMDDFDRENTDLENEDDWSDLIALQGARDAVEGKTVADEDRYFLPRAQMTITKHERAKLELRSKYEAKGAWTEKEEDRERLNRERVNSIQAKIEAALSKWDDSAFSRSKAIDI